jgi:PAS domain S-box-containing protein
MSITDLNGKYVYANDAFCKITGYTLEELVKTDFLSITHADYQASNVELARRLLAEEVPAYVIQKEYVKKGGALVWVKNSVSLLRDKDGKPSGVVTICEDISERKVIQSALEESEERFRVQFKATPVPIFSWRSIGDDFMLVDYNDAADCMTHRGIIKLLGRRASQLYVATPEVFEIMNECFKEKRTIRKAGEFKLISTGEVKQLDVSFVYVPPDRVMIHTEDITERMLAEKAKLEAERKFREIFENAHEGIFQSTPDGRFLRANPALARILGFDSPEQLIRERTNIATQHFVNAERREELKQLLATHGFVQAFELEVYLRNGERIWLSESVRTVADASGNTLYYEGITEDITERKQAENELRAQKEILQEVFDHIPVMITFVDQDGRIKLVNQEFERTIGWTQHEILEDDVDVFLQCYPSEPIRNSVRDFVKRSDGSWEQCRPLTKDGRIIDTSWAVVRLSDGSSIGIGKDITEEKQAEINLRNYSRRLLDVQENERKYIAQELHDEIGQVLTAVRINLQGLQNSCESPSLNTQITDDIRVIDEALNRVRNLSFELRPSLLDDLGLAAATRWYVDRYTKRAGITADVQIDSEITNNRLSRDVETACFRILQEALTNVARHAKAQNVCVCLDAFESILQLSVKDDGCGMDVGALNTPKDHLATLGLHGMEERALVVAGRFELFSAVSQGTEIRATFPLLPQRETKPIPPFIGDRVEDRTQH